MEELAKIFYASLRSGNDTKTAAYILALMSGNNTEKGYAKKLRLIAAELEKIDDDPLPF